MPKRVSTVLGREFGDTLREAIARTGMRESELARRLKWEHAKLSDLVNGKAGVSLDDFTYLLGMCQTAPDEFKYLKDLYLESRERGWLQLYDSPVPPRLRALTRNQQIAKTVVTWSSMFLPGLAQIESYARALAENSPFVEAKDVGKLVTARMERRELVANTRRFVFYVYEPVLCSPVGGLDVLGEQLHEILRLMVRPYISVRIVPAGRALTGDFTMLSFAKYEPMAYVEGLNSALFLDDRSSIALYAKVLAKLDEVALGEDASRRWIDRLLTRGFSPHDPPVELLGRAGTY
ncbi:helix-turn-helix domain-containing protein [Lentzea sp. NPDC058436]|uniref:helix-turn-helix domain-containing protein n=1 Tax=Lentzea sp. NPDC058436 TaxID=3346499 RepID=UPI003649AFE8